MTTTPSLVEARDLFLRHFANASTESLAIDAALCGVLTAHTPPAPYCARCGSAERSDTALTDTVVLSGRYWNAVMGKPEAEDDATPLTPRPVPRPDDDAELAAIRERCEKASDGPWTIQRGGGKARVIDNNGHGVAQFANFNSRSNRIFIARARTDTPALLSRIDAERARAEAAEAEVEWLRALKGVAVLAFDTAAEEAKIAVTRAERAEAENARLREALEFIAEEHDAGRHDGKPEACPAHEGESMWLCAIAALEQKEPSR